MGLELLVLPVALGLSFSFSAMLFRLGGLAWLLLSFLAVLHAGPIWVSNSLSTFFPVTCRWHNLLFRALPMNLVTPFFTIQCVVWHVGHLSASLCTLNVSSMSLLISSECVRGITMLSFGFMFGPSLSVLFPCSCLYVSLVPGSLVLSVGWVGCGVGVLGDCVLDWPVGGMGDVVVLCLLSCDCEVIAFTASFLDLSTLVGPAHVVFFVIPPSPKIMGRLGAFVLPSPLSTF